MNRMFASIAAVVALLVLPAAAVAGHGLELRLDHPSTAFAPQAPLSDAFTSGGRGATWEPIATFATGNPQTDLDFFTQGGNTYASVGTLGIGPNSGGQQIFQLTDGDEVDPRPLASHPSASCVSNAADATGLQHDVEATPKGNAILNTDVISAARSDTQLLLDATDAPGRCHDQGTLGAAGVPQGGLEIIDVTDIENPQVIGLTSHIGEAHTVNVDPRRPHIAYAVTSDQVTVNAEGVRQNEVDGSSNRLNLDGFEVVDLSTCMDFPATATLEQKRAACRPEVYRYRYPSTEMSLGHTNKGTIFGCHELEVYPDDRLMCASGAAMIALDMRGAFDDRGTPANLRDDKPRGTPLPCRVRESSSAPPFTTGAMVTDCTEQTEGEGDLDVPSWIAAGAPSLTGVGWLGSAFHAGRESATGAADPKFDSTEDIDFDHEAELTHSGRFVIATDERGGGILPPGASCSPSSDLKQGNGGLHAYAVDRLLRRRPASAEDAFSSYARNSEGEKAIHRVPIRTKPQGSLCTAHVFQQIPGQNRIFMGWYSQGTQVIDYVENADGTFDFEDAAYFIPANADQWVSHIFKVDRNADGSFTYFGAAADFALGDAGRNAVEVYKVTLPAPPAPRALAPGIGPGFEPSSCLAQRVRIGPRNVGRLRLGQSRPVTARRARPLGDISSRTRVYRYCIKGPHKRERSVAVFDGRGKLRVAATNARGHTRHRLGRSSTRRELGRRFGSRLRRVSKAVRIVRGSRRSRSRVVFVMKSGRVRYVAIVDRKLARKRGIMLAYLRRAKMP